MDKFWYYTAGGKEQRGPVSEEQLRAKIRAGEIKSSELVWSDGMSEWKPVISEPTFQSAFQQTTAPAVIPAPTVAAQSAVPPFGGWLTLVGICNIIAGALMIISCFGALIGIFMLLSGVAALGAKTALDQMAAVPAEFSPALAKFRQFFLYTGIVLILNIVFTVFLFLSVLVSAGGLVAALAQFADQLPQ